MSTIGGPNIIRDGLVLYLDAVNTKSYPGTGNTWYDLVGSNNGIIGSTVTYNSIPKGLSFDGTDEIVALPKIITTSNFTIIQSIKYVGSTGEGWIFEQYNYGAGRLIVYISSDHYLKFFIGGTTVTAPTPLTSGKQYIIAVTRNGTTGSIYINGVMVGTGVISSNILDDTVCAIGGSTVFASTKQFIGDIYTTQVYNRSMSTDEIQQNFNAYRGRFNI